MGPGWLGEMGEWTKVEWTCERCGHHMWTQAEDRCGFCNWFRYCPRPWYRRGLRYGDEDGDAVATRDSDSV
jgi:ribosomal protein L37E